MKCSEIRGGAAVLKVIGGFAQSFQGVLGAQATG